MTVYSTTVVSDTTIFDFDTESTSLLITRSGTLIGTGAGDVVVGTTAYNRVTVNGEIASDRSYAIDLDGNYSSVSISRDGIVSANSVAIRFGGLGGRLDNHGSISGAWGVTHYGEGMFINNSGEITGYMTGDYYYFEAGLFLIDDEDNDTASRFEVVNTGTISGNSVAIYAGESAYYTYYASELFLTNAGSLIGTQQHGGVIAGAGNDTVVNSGLIVGFIDLGDDDDYFDGRGGTVVGDVRGGNGDDTYVVNDGATVLTEHSGMGTDTVRAQTSWALGDHFENLNLIGAGDFVGTGNDGDNVISGNSGNNTLHGESGDDTLNGGVGNDKLIGGWGIDLLNGGNGEDLLIGEGGNDRMIGNDGDDLLVGNSGNDRLFGGSGEDVLSGGHGKDILTGGSDNDVFLFRHVNHSLNSSDRDVIKDFV